MHFAIYTLAATFCALSASALPLPQTDIAEPLTLDIPSGYQPPADTVHWFTAEGYNKDPLRRRDPTVKDLVTENIWELPPPSSGGKDPDPLRRRDSPLHNLPPDGTFESGAPEPRIRDSDS